MSSSDASDKPLPTKVLEARVARPATCLKSGEGKGGMLIAPFARKKGDVGQKQFCYVLHVELRRMAQGSRSDSSEIAVRRCVYSSGLGLQIFWPFVGVVDAATRADVVARGLKCAEQLLLSTSETNKRVRVAVVKLPDLLFFIVVQESSLVV